MPFLIFNNFELLQGLVNHRRYSYKIDKQFPKKKIQGYNFTCLKPHLALQLNCAFENLLFF